MKIVTWNVNGIRAAIKKGFYDFVAAEAPDYLCLQESRATSKDVELALPDYEPVWNPAEKKGYSGTLTLCREPPLSLQRGVGVPDLDHEGRVVTVETPEFYLVNVYTPNAKRDLSRLDERTRQWDVAFLAHVRQLQNSKPVIFCGDLNVAHTEEDLANPKANKKTHGFTPEERAGFDRIVEAGFIDAFREFHSGNGHYTWWAQWGGARERNVGWRLDYFCVSEALRPRLRAVDILADVTGSDHCPVRLELD